MSVTFSRTNAPEVLDYEYPCCDRPTCPHCGGTGSEKVMMPEGYVNVSNANAYALLAPLGENELWGSWSGDRLHTIAKRLTKARALTDLSSDDHEETGANGARLIEMGRDASYATHRYEQLQQLVMRAIEEGDTVTWG